MKSLIKNYINLNLFKRNLFSKIFFVTCFYIKFFKLFRHNYRIIFKNQVDYSKLKLIYSLPRSGTHYSCYIINSYTEMLYNLGDGTPKIKKDKKFLNEDELIYGIKKTQLVKRLDFKFQVIDEELPEIDYDQAYVGHHPIPFDNLIDFNKIKPVVLIRSPEESISSYVLLDFNRRLKKHKIKINDIYNYKTLIFHQCNLHLKFLDYWEKKYKENNEKILIIRFEDLINETFLTCSKIINFWNIKLDEKLLLKSIEINSKDNLKKKGYSNFVVQTPEHQNELRKKIKEIIKAYIKNKKISFSNLY